MNKKLQSTALLFGLLTCSFFSKAQAPGWEWVKSGGGSNFGTTSYGAACINDNSGNTFLTGLHGDTMAVQKFDANGNLIWTTKTTQKTSLNKISDIAIDATGNIYVVGNFRDTCYFGSTMMVAVPGYSWINAGFLAKLDPNGNYLWAIKTNESGRCETVTVDSNNDVLVGGYVGNNLDLQIGGLTVPKLSTQKHLFIAKINPSGTGIWGKVYEAASASAPSGSDCSVNDITSDNAGNVYFTGTFNGGVSVNFGGTALSTSGPEMFVAKTDNAGTLQWVKQSTSSLSYMEASGQGIGVDATGNVYAIGWIEENTTFGSFTATYSGSASSFNTIALVKYNSTGTEQWVKAFGKIKDAVAATKNLGLVTTSSGNCYLAASAGSYISGIDFGDGISFSFSASSKKVNFVVKTNENGVTQWAKLHHDNLSDEFYNLSNDVAENIYVSGTWITGTGFDALSAPASPYGILLAKLGSNPLNATEIINENIAVLLYPNPASSSITVSTDKNQLNYKIFAPDGKLVLENTMRSTTETIATDKLPSGIYTLVAYVGSFVKTTRFIVQH